LENLLNSGLQENNFHFSKEILEEEFSFDDFFEDPKITRSAIFPTSLQRNSISTSRSSPLFPINTLAQISPEKCENSFFNLVESSPQEFDSTLVLSRENAISNSSQESGIIIQLHPPFNSDSNSNKASSYQSRTSKRSRGSSARIKKEFTVEADNNETNDSIPNVHTKTNK
jgi:hypothetical protein